MKGSEWLREHARDSLPAWEASVVEAARRGDVVSWPLVAVSTSLPATTSGEPAHQGVFLASTDYLALGETGDYVRVPLTPIAAQQALDALGYVLPTPRMVHRIWEASQIKLDPLPLVPNKGANLQQYAEHNEAVSRQLLVVSPGFGSQGPTTDDRLLPFLVSGQKKDVVVGRAMRAGRVVIFGWYRPDGTYVQPETNVHGDYYVDYSHGIRAISPVMTVDGTPRTVASVLADPRLSGLLSGEGAVIETSQRYPVRRNLAQTGLDALVAEENPTRRTA